MSTTSWLLASCALAAGWALLAGAARLYGRSILAAREAPDLAERLQRHRAGLVGFVFGGALAQGVVFALCVGEPGAASPLGWLLFALAVVPGAFLAVAAGDFPTRRTLFEESWSFAAYLGFQCRFLAVLVGFWLGLIAAPAIVAASGPRAQWLVAAACALALGLWCKTSPWLARWLLRTEPLDDPELERRLAEVVARADAAPDEILRFGPRNGRFCNAFALPAPRASAVVLSHGLLEALEPDEVVGVFAHEMSHIEEFDPAKLRRLGAFVLAAIGLGCFGGPLLALMLPGAAAAWPALFLMALVAIGLSRIHHHREHEAESDVRAAELCGDAAAVERGLIKIYAANGMPRRLRADAERMSSHPSLARRVQALRRWAAEQSGADVDDGAQRSESTLGVRARSKPDRAWLLGPDRIDFLAGLPDDVPDDPRAWPERSSTQERVAYEDVVELQAERRFSGPRLRCQQRCGKVRHIDVSDDDLHRLGSALERADLRLAPLRKAAGAGHVPVALLGTIAALASVLLLGLGGHAAGTPLLLLLLALAFLLRRTRPWIVALGAVAVVGALLQSVAADLPWRNSETWWLLALQAGAGLGCLWLGLRGSGDRDEAESGGLADGHPGLVATLIALAAAPGVWLGLALLFEQDAALRLAALGREARAALLPLAGAGAALWLCRTAPARALAVAMLALALTPVLLGSALFRGFAGEPLIAAAPPWSHAEPRDAARLAQLDLPHPVWDLELAPDGRRFLAQGAAGYVAGDAHDGTGVLFTLADFDGDVQYLRALDATFSGPDRLLLAVDRDGRLALREVAISDPGQPVWERDLERPVAAGAAFELSAHEQHWRVSIHAAEGESEVLSGETRARAPLGRDAAPAGEGPFHTHFVSSGSGAGLEIGRENGAGRIAASATGMALTQLQFLLGGTFQLVHVREHVDARPAGSFRSALDLHCAAPQPSRRGSLCLASDALRSWVWRIDPGTGERSVLGRVPAARQWTWDGARLVLLDRRQLRVGDPAQGRMLTLRLPVDTDWRTALSAAPGAAALALPEHGGEAARVVVFSTL